MSRFSKIDTYGAVPNRTYRVWENIELPKYFVKLHTEQGNSFSKKDGFERGSSLRRSAMSIENATATGMHSVGVLCPKH